MGLGLLASTLGIFMSATRTNALILFILVVASMFTGKIRAGYRFRWLLLLQVVGYGISGEERLQRFRSLQDPEFIVQRIGDSVNRSFLDLVRNYPLGNGLGGGGTSVPYFLQDRIRNAVVMENEYARILLELGIPGLCMWAVFIGWIFTRRHIKREDLFYVGRRLAYVVCACVFTTGLIGTGLFTSVPSTTILLLLTGWIVVPEVAFAPVTAEAANRIVAPPAVNYGRTG